MGSTWTDSPHLTRLSREFAAACDRPAGRLLVTMPPRHGKSTITSHYGPLWYLLNRPRDRVILASYEAGFAAEWGRRVRNSIEEFGPAHDVALAGDSTAADRWDLETRGGMVTAGVGGALTGRGANLFIIDDPVKNAEEAWSETYRRRAWEWYQAVARTRLEPAASIVLVMTRWHRDDLAGRILEKASEAWTVVSMPALDAHGRALWPERFPRSALDTIRADLSDYYWSALYQQNPTERSGGMFQRSAFSVVDIAPPADATVRYWDLAASSEGDWTVGLRLSRRSDGRMVFYCVEHVVRGRWASGERDRRIVETAREDGFEVRIGIEQEPGSGGVAQADALVNQLRGYSVEAFRSTGKKRDRADPVASQAQRGFVALVRGPWTSAFLDEAEAFPMGAHDDQVDALSGAFAMICASRGGEVYVDRADRNRKDRRRPRSGPKVRIGHWLD